MSLHEAAIFGCDLLFSNALTEHLLGTQCDTDDARCHRGAPKSGGNRPNFNLTGCSCDELIHFGDADEIIDHTQTPWWDPNDRHSEDFYGLYSLDWDGFDDSTYERQAYTSLANGAVFGRARNRAKRWTVRGVLVAETCCGAAYGLEWLKSVLRGCVSCDQCQQDDWEFLNCCPDCVSCSCDLLDEVRTLKNVALVSGPRVVDCVGGGCGCGGCGLMIVEFDMMAGTPWSFGPEKEVCSFPLSNDVTECPTFVKVTETDCILCSDEEITWTDDPGLCGTGDCGGDDCPDEGSCGQSPCIGEVPVRPPDIDVCEDQCDPFVWTVNCCTISEVYLDEFQDTVPILDLYAGDGDLENVRITFQPNPLNLPASELDECEQCAEIIVPFVAAGSTLTIDGTTQRSMLSCPGQDCQPVHSYYGAGFEWPVFDCGGVPYTVCVRANGANVPDNATMTVSVATRYQ